MRNKREAEIFEAAYGVLAEKGYKGASMLEIAKAAKASNETLYKWYGSKEGLLAEMIKANAAEAAGKLSNLATVEGPDDPMIRLEAFGTALLMLLTGEKSVLLNRAAAADVAQGGTLGRLLAEHGRSKLAPLVTQTVSAAQATGQLRAHEPEEISEIYLALLIGDLQIRRAIGVTRAPSEEAISGHSQRVVELIRDLFGA